MNNAAKINSVSAVQEDHDKGQFTSDQEIHFAAQSMARNWTTHRIGIMHNPLIYVDSIMNTALQLESFTKREMYVHLCDMLPSVRPQTIWGMVDLKYGDIGDELL